MQNSGGQPNAAQNQITANFEDGHRSALHCFAVFTLRGALSDIEHRNLHRYVGFIEHQHGGRAGGDDYGDSDGDDDEQHGGWAGGDDSGVHCVHPPATEQHCQFEPRELIDVDTISSRITSQSLANIQ